MPQFELSNETAVLVKIPPGKSYISNPQTHLTQKPQKQGTCWYYVLNYLRPRYGKDVDKLIKVVSEHKELKEIQESHDYQSLQKARQIEKAISSCRKKLTQFDHREQDSSKETQQKDTEDKRQQERFKLARELVISLHGHEFERQYIQAIAARKEKSKKLLVALLPEEEKHNYPTAPAVLEEETKLLILACSNAYGLKVSSWKTQHGFDALMQELKEHGALDVIGCFGQSNYKTAPQCSKKKFGSFHVYYWRPGDHTGLEDYNGHSILIIGAEKLENKKYVYYIDPNNSLSPNNKRIVYKISYERFEQALLELHGSKGLINFLTGQFLEIIQKSLSDAAALPLKKEIKEISDSAIYAFTANEKLQTEAAKQYERVLNKINQVSPATYEKHFKQIDPAPSLFPVPEKKEIKNTETNLTVKDLKEILNRYHSTSLLGKACRYFTCLNKFKYRSKEMHALNILAQGDPNSTIKKQDIRNALGAEDDPGCTTKLFGQPRRLLFFDGNATKRNNTNTDEIISTLRIKFS